MSRDSIRRTLGRLVALVVVLAPVVAAASEAAGEAGGNPWYDLIMKFVNFAILVGMLFYFLRKPVTQGLADRRANIKRELEEALKAKEAAEAKYKEYKNKVANLEAEVRRIQEDFQVEGERQKDRILAEAEKAAESIRAHAEAAGANEVKRASDELRAEVGRLAVELAEQMLVKAYTAKDQEHAVKLTIKNIEGLN